MASLQKGLADMDAEYDKCHTVYTSGEGSQWKDGLLVDHSSLHIYYWVFKLYTSSYAIIIFWMSSFGWAQVRGKSHECYESCNPGVGALLVTEFPSSLMCDILPIPIHQWSHPKHIIGVIPPP